MTLAVIPFPAVLNLDTQVWISFQQHSVLYVLIKSMYSFMEELPLIGISNVFAMDLDYETDCVFWADIEKDIIMKQCLNNVNGSSPEPLVISALQSVSQGHGV